MEDTRFKPGESGNPSGRPKGAKNKITLLKQTLEAQLRESAKDRMGPVLDKAIELALQGDRQMIKLLVDLHMTKGHTQEDRATEKVEINITTSGSPEPVTKPSPDGTTDVIEEIKNG